MIKKSVATAAFAGLVLMVGNPASAQALQETAAVTSDRGSSDDVKLFRRDLRSLKKQVIAANIELTDSEAQQFWPIYDRYAAEMVTIMDKKFELLEDYAQNYDSLTDEEADTYIQGRAAVEESILQLRLKYIPLFRKVLSAKAAALFVQMDWRISLVMDLRLASRVPIIEPN